MITEKEGIIIKKNLAEFAYDEIIRLIFDGEYKPGDLLTERDLSDKLGISRTPIREALKRLSEVNYVNHIVNRGAVVSEISSTRMVEQFEIRELFEKHAIEKIFDEGLVIDLDYLRSNIKETEEALDNGDYKKYSEVEREFHLEIIRLTGNKEMLDIMNRMKDMQFISLIYKRIRIRSNDSKETIKEHKAILEAFEQNNKEKVLQALIEHNARAKKRVSML